MFAIYNAPAPLSAGLVTNGQNYTSVSLVINDMQILLLLPLLPSPLLEADRRMKSSCILAENGEGSQRSALEAQIDQNDAYQIMESKVLQIALVCIPKSLNVFAVGSIT